MADSAGHRAASGEDLPRIAPMRIGSHLDASGDWSARLAWLYAFKQQNGAGWYADAQLYLADGAWGVALPCPIGSCSICIYVRIIC